MDPSFVDDYHATQNLDYTIRHGRRAGQWGGPHHEVHRSVMRGLAGRTPTHRKEEK